MLAFAALLLFGLQAQEGAKTNFFLPQNPVAAAYVLGRLSNEELIAAPRGEFVYSALLQRKGMDRKYRLEALDGLAQIRHSDRLAQLLSAFADLDRKGESSTETERELVPILLDSTPAQLAAQRDRLRVLARESRVPITRQAGYAALITAEGSGEVLWQRAAPDQLIDVISAIALVRDSALLGSFYPRVSDLVRTNTTPEIERAAITAISAIPGHDQETFNLLANRVESGNERASAVAGLRRIPQSRWPKDRLESLAEALVNYLQTVPAAERTGTEFTDALQCANELASLLPEARKSSLSKVLRGLGPAVFVLRAIYEQMRFDQQLLVVETGKPLAIVLKNEDAMPHNLAILMPGSLEEVGAAAEKMTPEPDAAGRLYVPATPLILQATRLVAPGQQDQLAFTAPAEPGDYPFVCTFPGHWRRMSGMLVVTKDVEAYLATNARARTVKFTEWKLDDLAPQLPSAVVGRNLEAGKELFTKLACVQCHKLGPHGYAYGPDLTEVVKRYKNDRTNVLEQILEPSKIVEERYRTFDFEIKDSEPLQGLVLREDAQSLTIQTGPADSLIQTIKKVDLLQRHPRSSSAMPLGLLNALSPEQIFDLLAYLEFGGEPHQHAAH